MSIRNKIIAALAIAVVLLISLWNSDCRANAAIRAQLKVVNDQAKADAKIAEKAIADLKETAIITNKVIVDRDKRISELEFAGNNLHAQLANNKVKTKKEIEQLNLDKEGILKEYGKLELNYNTAMTLLNNREGIIEEQRSEIIVLKDYKIKADQTIDTMVNAQASIELANKTCAKALSKKSRLGLRDIAALLVGAGLYALAG